MEGPKKKAAFVALAGRPSAGKSTLVNALCGQKVAITSPAPQTTRNSIRGIVNREDGQIVFVDTPGRHISEKKMNRRLVDVAEKAGTEADFLLWVIDASRAPGEEEAALADRLAGERERLFIAVNKCDRKDAGDGAVREFLRARFPDAGGSPIFTISALKKQGTDALLDAIFAAAPEGDPFYPEDYYTDQDISFRIAEIVREKAILRLRDELPHALYVEVADTELRENGSLLWVRAFVVVERESQKGMVVGKDGAMIRAIRDAALKDLKKIFDWKVYLDLRVKTSKDWRQNDRILSRIIDR